MKFNRNVAPSCGHWRQHRIPSQKDPQVFLLFLCSASSEELVLAQGRFSFVGALLQGNGWSRYFGTRVIACGAVCPLLDLVWTRSLCLLDPELLWFKVEGLRRLLVVSPTSDRMSSSSESLIPTSAERLSGWFTPSSQSGQTQRPSGRSLTAGLRQFIWNPESHWEQTRILFLRSLRPQFSQITAKPKYSSSSGLFGEVTLIFFWMAPPMRLLWWMTVKVVRSTGQVFAVLDHWTMHSRQNSCWHFSKDPTLWSSNGPRQM